MTHRELQLELHAKELRAVLMRLAPHVPFAEVRAGAHLFAGAPLAPVRTVRSRLDLVFGVFGHFPQHLDDRGFSIRDLRAASSFGDVRSVRSVVA